MPPRTNLLDLPPEMLEEIADRLGSFRSIVRLGKTHRNLLGITANVIKRKFKRLENAIKKKSRLKLLAAHLGLIRAVTWPDLNSGLCTQYGGQTLDCYERVLKGLPSWNWYHATSEYLNRFRHSVVRRLASGPTSRAVRHFYAASFFSLLKTQLRESYRGDALRRFTAALPNSWFGVLWTPRSALIASYHKDVVPLFNVLAAIRCAIEADVSFSRLKNFERTERIVLYGHLSSTRSKYHTPLHITIEVAGPDDLLDSLVAPHNIPDGCQGNFTFQMTIVSREAKNRGCSNEYKFSI